MDWKDSINKNPAVLLSDKQVRALLNDAFLNDQLKVNLMMNAFNIGIITEMRHTFPVSQFTLTRWSKKLVSDYGVTDDNAQWAIDNWISVLSTDVLRAIDKAEERAVVEEEQHRREEEEKRKREEVEAARRKTPTPHIRRKEDYDYYINPSLEISKDYIYVPCGYGQADNGFLIHGIKKEIKCNHKDANIYALVYNYLVKSSTIANNNIPKFLKNLNTVYEPNYQAIYRIAITLLQMIHHNMTQNGAIILNYPKDEDRESLRFAVQLIDHYASLFCRLIGNPSVQLQVKNDRSGIPFSVQNKTKGIYVTDNKKIVSNARDLWFGRKINYRLTKKNLKDLEYILHEISDFDTFKEGQFTALCDMLSCKEHAVCIMPTGSGKSLIFYLASLLQPLPMFIVSPTDILIQDQIRNLNKFHHMDNVAHLQLTEENSFEDWDICNGLNYITPMTFQNRNILNKSIHLNKGEIKVASGVPYEKVTSGSLISYVVLDEIHCLSNWGHDFRPEYLMLSKYLKKFLDLVTFWGFTATANYTVVEDVRKQLDIPLENFFSPIVFERFNVSYDFRSFHSEAEMLEEIASITAPLISRNERTIVFTKNDTLSKKVADAIGYEADIFSSENPTAYYQFAAGDCKVLVASDEIGVGINLPNITNVIHFGLPLSKNEFVQEIGRAGRSNEKVRSFILYLDKTSDNIPDGLLKRSTPIHRLSSLLEGYKNDYSDVYKKLSNGAVSAQELENQLIQIYRDFLNQDSFFLNVIYPFESIENSKKQLYMLYLTGFVNDWYTYQRSKDGTGIEIYVDLCNNDKITFKNDPNRLLNRMKERMKNYFVHMGNNRESIFKINKAVTPEEIIEVYVQWYYEKYLYHHNEQFLDFLEFIEANADCDSDKITEEIKEYFVLPFAKIKSDDALFNELSLKEIITKSFTGISKNTLVNLERINSDQYSYKIDLALFCGQLRMNSLFDESRLERVLSRLPDDETNQMANALSSFYSTCDTSAKIRILNYMEREANSLKTTYKDFLKNAYCDNQKDEVYYGIVASLLNKHFISMRRSGHV